MTTNNPKPCPVCKLAGQDVILEADYGERITYNCARCGKFTITRTAERVAEKRNLGPKLSAWIRNLFELGMDIPEINTNSLTEIEQSLPDYNASDKQQFFLRSIARKSKYPGDSVSLLPEFDYPLAWASAPEELLFYIRYLIARGLLAQTHEETQEFGDMSVSVEVTTDGWDYLDQHEQRVAELSQAFVAMSFSESMKTVWDQAIKPAINEAGYKAYRVDAELHIDRIDAKIIAEIKNSLFVVADVTEQKRGVYFEAGYAIGRNLPVIWCVRKDDLTNVHFDTRQYNHVVWESTKELKEKLYDVICAVIGRKYKI
jgi:nucleoside 2-deoxyribosyltransferase